jgi:hypothetical protein
MTIVQSIGYEGTVDYADVVQWLPYIGAGRYGVVDNGWRPSAGAEPRGVRIAAGWGWGHGVIDYNDAFVTLNLPSVASGQQWFMVVARRDWTAKTTTFEVLSGSSAKTLPARENFPANLDDQPIALCRVVAGSSVIAEIIDLRVWRGSYARSTLVREYYNEVGARLRIGNGVHERVLGDGTSPQWISRVVGDAVWTQIPQISTAENASSTYLFAYASVDGGAVLRGVVRKKTGTWSVGALVAVLPSGARPLRDTRAIALTDDGTVARLLISSNGRVTLLAGTEPLVWVAFDGLFIPRERSVEA